MNILKSLRKNWLWATLCLLCLFISLSRNVPVLKHPLSWWNVCWIVPLFALAIFASGNSWFIFRPIRWLLWPATRDYIERKIKALKDNPMVYPAIIWLDLGEGERAFISGGMTGFQTAFGNQTGGALEALEKLAAGMANCSHRGCGCHEEKAI